MSPLPNQTNTVEDLKRQKLRTLQSKGRRAVEKQFHALSELVIVYVSPTSIYPNAYNPNRQSEREFDLLCSSMREDGFTQPIIVDETSKEIVDGEHRWRAAQVLGLTELPVVYVSMTEQQKRIATLRHNRARGSEDIELTIQVLKELRDLGALEHAVDSLGMSDKELNALIDDLPASQVQASAEFSTSWVPKPDVLTEGEEDFKGRIVSVSPLLKKEQERLTSLADNAVSEEEHQVILSNRNHVPNRLSLEIHTEDHDIFRDMLGGEIAPRLLALIRYHLNKMGIRYGQHNGVEIRWMN